MNETNKLQQKISEFLPFALQQLIESCELFLKNFRLHQDEAKFTTDHKAFKLALSNIEILLKLEKFSLKSKHTKDTKNLENLLDQAIEQASRNQEKLAKN